MKEFITTIIIQFKLWKATRDLAIAHRNWKEVAEITTRTRDNAQAQLEDMKIDPEKRG